VRHLEQKTCDALLPYVTLKYLSSPDVCVCVCVPFLAVLHGGGFLSRLHDDPQRVHLHVQCESCKLSSAGCSFVHAHQSHAMPTINVAGLLCPFNTQCDFESNGNGGTNMHLHYRDVGEWECPFLLFPVTTSSEAQSLDQLLEER